MYCLLKANHKRAFISVKTGRGMTTVEVGPGQFIFGRKQAAKDLNLPPSTIRNKLSKLVGLGKVDTQPDTHYTIITIVNWATYQILENKEDRQQDNQRTGKGQAKDTNKNDKNEKKQSPDAKSAGKREVKFSDIDMKGAKFLLTRIQEHSPHISDKHIDQWANTIRLIRERDNKTNQQITDAIYFAVEDNFWHGVILSANALRRNMDKLLTKASQLKQVV